MKNGIKIEVIDGFLSAGREFCRVVENRSEFSQIKFCQLLYSPIVDLLKYASEIPGYFDLHNFKKDRKQAHADWKSLYASLAKQFGVYNHYQEIFDPYDKREKGPIYGSLSDDIADIYGDIKFGLSRWEGATPKLKRQLLSNWRFNFEIHWGEHGTSALRALYFILFRIVDGKDDLPVGLHKKSKKK